MDNYVPEIEEYQKRLNWYLQEHYPAYKKITSEEWNALFMALINQGNAQEDTLAQICNSILPVHVTTINELIDVTNNHNSQINSLENSISTHTQEISALETLAQNNKTRLNTVEPVVSTHTQKITALETLTQSNKTRLNTIEPIVSNHSTHISALETLTTQHTAAIASKQAQITTTNKLDADLIKNGVSNKVFTAEEKTKLSTLENTPIASLSTLGKIKPDGSTVIVDADGTLHSQSPVGSVEFSAITGEAKDNTSLATELAKKIEEKDAVPTQPIDPFANYYNKQETQNLISNPNLLINGDFRVNQRGQNSYTGTGNHYTVDRWRANSNSVVTVLSKGLQLSPRCEISQFFESDFYAALNGKTVTFTISTDVGIITKTFVWNSSQAWTNLLEYNGWRLAYAGNGYIRITNLSTTNNATIYWVKLEIGNVATPFSPRPYAEELAMCQRYYINSKPYGTYQAQMLGYCVNTTTASFILNLPVSLKTNHGTVNVVGNLRFLTGGNSFTYNATSPTISNQHATPVGYMIDFGFSSNLLTAGNVIKLNSEAGGYIELDAEIY